MELLFFLQIALLPWEIISYFERKSEKGRLRIIVFTLLHTLFCSLWFLQNNSSFQSNSTFLFAAGIITIAYTFYYWCIESPIIYLRRHVNVFFGCLLFGYILNTVIQQGVLEGHNWLNHITYAYFQLLAFIFIGGFYLRIIRNRPILSSLEFGVIFSSGLTLILPSAIYFIESSSIHYLLYNAIYFSVAIGYSVHYIKQSRLEEIENRELLRIIALQEEKSIALNSRNEEQCMVIQELNEELEQFKQPDKRKELLILEFDKYDLTPKEKTVAILLLEGKSNTEIASIENVSEGTIRSHAMKIYSKTEITGNKKEKVLKFRNKFNHLDQ